RGFVARRVYGVARTFAPRSVLRRSAARRDHEQRLSRRNRSTLLAQHARHVAVVRGVDRELRLHEFEHEQLLAGLYTLAVRHRELPDHAVHVAFDRELAVRERERLGLLGRGIHGCGIRLARLGPAPPLGIERGLLTLLERRDVVAILLDEAV